MIPSPSRRPARSTPAAPEPTGGLFDPPQLATVAACSPVGREDRRPPATTTKRRKR